MSKERLEEMNRKVTGLTDSFGDFADVVQMDVDTYAWFYEQAGRFEAYVKETVQVHEQNKRYREALQAIRNDDSLTYGQSINIAREALEESE